MKAILISIRPQHTCNILNDIKWWEIRKKFPKDYVGWVYIYCTKDKKYANLINRGGFLTGMVVARFWCDKVEDYVNGCLWKNEDNSYSDYEKMLKPSCLTEDELYDYCEDLSFKAIHITKLEIFDKPKEISEFYRLGAWKVYEEQFDSSYMKRTEQEIMKSLSQTLTRAPQSWCYIEI